MSFTACSFSWVHAVHFTRTDPEWKIRAVAKHLKISGRVQGVGFRYCMAEEAVRLGVTGWVRNRRDGTVEAVVDGAPDVVAAILEWARRGPPAAHVTEVQVSEVPGSFERFAARPTE
jgi:acylphosphatase